MRIYTVVGARPQFIKAAVLSRVLRDHPELGIEESIIHTGQHYDANMSDVFFDELQIPKPLANLDVGGGGHGEATGKMLQLIEQLLIRDKPDLVLVYGDTNSTLAGALAASKLHIPVAHVEAGLRSHNRAMPEEINRVLTDHISDLLFCTSQVAIDNLTKEGVTQNVFQVGDTMYDSALYYGAKAASASQSKPFALATVHRAENTDDEERLRRIFEGLARSPIQVKLPLHPRTQAALKRSGIAVSANIKIIDPLSYIEMIENIKNCSFVLTDSGGLQKEAYFLGKRCITLRDETEWVELVDQGANRIVGASAQAIADAYEWAVQPLGQIKELYGDGNSGMAIAKALHDHFKKMV